MSRVEWEYQRMLVPRGTTRRACTQLLTEKAEHDAPDRLSRVQLPVCQRIGESQAYSA